MKLLSRNWILVLALFVGVLLVGGLGWHFYSRLARPTLERNGGTILIYELEQENSARGCSPERMAAAIARRLDPLTGMV
jgi:hypothetical protein